MNTAVRQVVLVVIACSVIAVVAWLGGKYTSLGRGLSMLPGEGPWFEETAVQSGLAFVYHSGQTGQHRLPEIMGGGVALFDMDGDGHLDVFLTQADGLTEPRARGEASRLFRNRGDGRFDDVSARSGAEVTGYGMGVTAADYNNDGKVDLYVTRVGSNILLRNDGEGQFSDATANAGVADSGWSTSTAFVDVDADGNLDLFVVHYINWSPSLDLRCFSPAGAPDYCSPKSYHAPSPASLYRNNGDGTFTDVTSTSGVATSAGNGLGVTTGDFNDDGKIDLFVANDGTPNHLWLNQGGGRFRNAALEMGAAVDLDGTTKAGMGTHAVDADDDGDLDLLVVNLAGETDSFFRNQKGYFTDDAAAVGLRMGSRSFTRFGTGLIDFDNDGRLDLFEANGAVTRGPQFSAADPYAEPSLLFRGTETGRFHEVAPRAGVVNPLIGTSRGAAFGDLDNDGGVDIVVVNRDAPAYVLHNSRSPRGHWVGFHVLEEHGRDAIGAQVSIVVAGKRVRRDVQTAFSYLASNDPRVHFGLGAETAAQEVVVRWLDGLIESFGAVRGDQYVALRRGSGIRVQVAQ